MTPTAFVLSKVRQQSVNPTLIPFHFGIEPETRVYSKWTTINGGYCLRHQIKNNKMVIFYITVGSILHRISNKTTVNLKHFRKKLLDPALTGNCLLGTPNPKVLKEAPLPVTKRGWIIYRILGQRTMNLSKLYNMEFVYSIWRKSVKNKTLISKFSSNNVVY